MPKRLISLVSVAALAVGASAAVIPGALAAGRQSPYATHGCDTGADDFDGNGGTDLAIGAPYAHGGGAVQVKMKLSGGIRTVTIHRPRGSKATEFGQSVSDIDLSRHTDPRRPCADLAVGSTRGVFIYRWSRPDNRFVLLNTITGADVGPHLSPEFDGFGTQVATQTEPGDSVHARRPVLWVSAPGARGDVGAVVRLVLNPNGTIKAKQVIKPGGKPTPRMPVTAHDDPTFGQLILGTPFADEVLISVPGYGHGGSVLVWRTSGPTTVITERKLIKSGAPGLPAHAHTEDEFGSAMFLDTAVSAATHTGTKLLVGAPGVHAAHGRYGAVWVLRYLRENGRVRLSKPRYWTLNSSGVNAPAASLAGFGGALGAVVSRHRRALILVGGIGSHGGEVSVLGTGRYFTERNLGIRHPGGANFGALIADWHDVKDHLPHDRWQGKSPGSWALRTVVDAGPAYNRAGNPTGHELVISGLPLAGNAKTRIFRPHLRCHRACYFGSSLTSGAGGGYLTNFL